MSDSFQLPFGSREERVAYNESWSRDLNRRRAEWDGLEGGGGRFRCECWRVDCDAQIELSEEEWRTVRSAPNRFAVAPEHVAPDVEAVTEKRQGFWIVEKLGEAGALAEQLSE